MARVMILSGGWPGHRPDQLAEHFTGCLGDDHQVTHASDLDVLRPEVLSGVDILLLNWTFGDLPEAAESALLRAVESGMGLMAWHGATSAFLASRAYKFLLGGQFVDHPGGDAVQYRVRFLDDDPLGAGLGEIALTSEQYYLLVDPSVRVVATTVMQAEGKPWVAGVDMPVAWKRPWGRGRVFYCALGHRRVDLESAAVRELFRRAIRWLSPGQ